MIAHSEYAQSLAWIGDVQKANDVHPLVECSNRGVCNRETGMCECLENFDGIACERTLAEDAGRVYETPWDADKHVGCVCDVGFRGPDCSLRECPSGPDIMKGFGNEAVLLYLEIRPAAAQHLAHRLRKDLLYSQHSLSDERFWKYIAIRKNLEGLSSAEFPNRH
eukprot:gene27549-33274_t